jgi:peptidoglycan/LPS O-acetylase OafA/YrhL
MQRLHRLDGLRGVLAVYVMLGHALPFTVAPAWVQTPFSHGEAAVDLFFALSGLVIINSVDRFEGAFWPFMRARARRLLPVYGVALVFALAVLAVGTPVLPWVGVAGRHIMEAGLPSPLWAHVLAHLTLTQGLIPQGALPFAYVTLLGPAWSLSTEWQFYVVIGLCAPRDFRVVACVLMAAGLAYHAVSGWLPPWWGFSRAFLPDAAPYFALGLASAAWLRGQGVACLLVCAGLAMGLGSGSGRFVIPLVWLLVLAALKHPAGRVLEGRVVQFLGAVSYPLYLFNEPVQRGLALLTPFHSGLIFSLLWLPISVVVVVGLSWLIHEALEVDRPRPKIAKVFWRLFVHKKKSLLPSSRAPG